jgi:TolB protein
MKVICSKKLLWLFILCMLASSMGALKADSYAIDAGEITRKAATEVKRIAISSNNSKLQDIALKAFNTHGAYQIVPASQASFTFHFNAVGANAIQLKIEGAGKQQLFEQIIKHTNELEALYRACDLAVLKTIGTPGYFAGKLAFIGTNGAVREVYMSDLLFQKVSQLTHDRSEALLPHLSADAKTIVYTTYFKSGFPDIYKIDLTTGRRVPFATYRGINIGAIFNPAGTAVALILSSSGNTELYVSDVNGLRPKRITHNKSLKASPAWSPDGSRIILTSDEMGAPQLFEVTLPNGSMRRLSTNISKYCAEPTWNPRNTHLIAFTASMSGRFELALFDLSTQTSKFLTSKNGGSSLDPCWTNDGRHIIFTRKKGAASQLFILDTKTGKEVPLHASSFGNFSQACFVYPH